MAWMSTTRGRDQRHCGGTGAVGRDHARAEAIGGSGRRALNLKRRQAVLLASLCLSTDEGVFTLASPQLWRPVWLGITSCWRGADGVQVPGLDAWFLARSEAIFTAVSALGI